MSPIPTRLACLALLSLAALAPCRAEGLASSASSAGSASVGSLSDSIHGSSNSSSRDDRQVSAGDYRVVEVGAAAERPGLLRLKLQGTAPQAGDAFYLDLPAQALAPRGLAAGDVVRARQRPYGLEFARADSGEAFFLVLADDWRRELDPHPLAL